MSNPRCIICNSTNWKNADKYTTRETDFSICQACGFCCHLSKIKSKAALKAFYKKDYRQPPSAANFLTSQRKMHYHQEFLGELYTKWGKGDKKPVIFDSGAAYGVFLKWSSYKCMR